MKNKSFTSSSSPQNGIHKSPIDKRFVNSHYANTKTLIFLVYFSFTLGMISLLGGIIFSFLFGISSTVVPTWISYILLVIAVIGLLISTVLRIMGGSPFYSLRGGSNKSYVKSENDITKFRTNHTLDTLLIFNTGLIFFPSFLIWFNEGSKSPYSFILLFLMVLISVIGTLFYILTIKNKMIRELGFAYNKNVQELEKNGINAIYIANDPKEIRERILTKESQYTEDIKTRKMLAEQRAVQKDLSVDMNQIGVNNQLKDKQIRELELEQKRIEGDTRSMESHFYANQDANINVNPNLNINPTQLNQPQVNASQFNAQSLNREFPKVEFIEDSNNRLNVFDTPQNNTESPSQKTIKDITNEFYKKESVEDIFKSGKWRE